MDRIAVLHPVRTPGVRREVGRGLDFDLDRSQIVADRQGPFEALTGFIPFRDGPLVGLVGIPSENKLKDPRDSVPVDVTAVALPVDLGGSEEGKKPFRIRLQAFPGSEIGWGADEDVISLIGRSRNFCKTDPIVGLLGIKINFAQKMTPMPGRIHPLGKGLRATAGTGGNRFDEILVIVVAPKFRKLVSGQGGRFVRSVAIWIDMIKVTAFRQINGLGTSDHVENRVVDHLGAFLRRMVPNQSGQLQFHRIRTDREGRKTD